MWSIPSGIVLIKEISPKKSLHIWTNPIRVLVAPNIYDNKMKIQTHNFDAEFTFILLHFTSITFWYIFLRILISIFSDSIAFYDCFFSSTRIALNEVSLSYAIHVRLELEYTADSIQLRVIRTIAMDSQSGAPFLHCCCCCFFVAVVIAVKYSSVTLSALSSARAVSCWTFCECLSFYFVKY